MFFCTYSCMRKKQNEISEKRHLTALQKRAERQAMKEQQDSEKQKAADVVEAITFTKEKKKTKAAPAAEKKKKDEKHCLWVQRRSCVYCPECGKGYRICNGGPNVYTFNYCPNCGKQMMW